MAEEKEQSKKEEKEYIIPLRKATLKKPKYKRTGIAIKTIKQYVAKHMKIPDKDVSKVKLDPYFNNDIWFRGRAKPPAKIKVKVIKEGDIVNVTFVEEPEIVKFARARNEKRHKPSEDPKKKPAKEEKPEEKSSEEAEEEKKEEKEKSKSAADQKAQQAAQQAKAQKHTTKMKEPSIQRKALKK